VIFDLGVVQKLGVAGSFKPGMHDRHPPGDGADDHPFDGCVVRFLFRVRQTLCKSAAGAISGAKPRKRCLEGETPARAMKPASSCWWRAISLGTTIA
jgi:hypothetical protein